MKLCNSLYLLLIVCFVAILVVPGNASSFHTSTHAAKPAKTASVSTSVPEDEDFRTELLSKF